VSQPPDYPGRERFKRAAAAAGSEAYQGAFEAIGSVLIACAFGYWVDTRWDTSPVGLLVGTAVGFAAMVLRLVRLGKEIHPDSTGLQNRAGESKGGQNIGPPVADDRSLGESPGISSVLREEREERHNERKENDESQTLSDPERKDEERE